MMQELLKSRGDTKLQEKPLRQKLAKMLQLHGYSACQETLVLLEDHFTTSSYYDSLQTFISKLNHIITFQTSSDSSIIDPDLAHLIIKVLRDEHVKQQKLADNLEIPEEEEEVVEEPVQEPPLSDELLVKVKCAQSIEQTSTSKANQGPAAPYHTHFNPFVQHPSNLPVQTSSLSVDKPGSDFTIHYNFLYKRLSALPIFQQDFRLTKLQTLTESNEPSIRCICFGLLVKNLKKIDGYLLIDSSGRVPLKITPDTNFKNRLAYVNCIVLVEGVYTNPNDVLFAANIGYPPILLDPLIEKSLCCRDDRIIVLLSELFLDEDDTLKALETLFCGYDSTEVPPFMFVMIGNFTREPCRNSDELNVNLKKLMRLIRACENLKKSHFVIIPGAGDTKAVKPSMEESFLPKPAFSQDLFPTNHLKVSNFNNIHLASNPTHIYFGDRQITVAAHSYLKELGKGLLHDLSDHREELFETAKQIVLSNAHLCAGIEKSYRDCLKVWHRPDLLLLADTKAFGRKYDYNSSKTSDTSFATMLSFSRQNFHFKVYYMRSGMIEESQVE